MKQDLPLFEPGVRERLNVVEIHKAIQTLIDLVPLRDAKAIFSTNLVEMPVKSFKVQAFGLKNGESAHGTYTFQMNELRIAALARLLRQEGTPETVEDTDIYAMGLKKHTVRALEGSDITTVSTLQSYSVRQLKTLPGFGEAIIKDIMDSLDKRKIRMTY